MDLTGAGGGIMLALAAGLWLAYLVPNWLRRTQFNATERNAVRLSQTIRVLAETAEGPKAHASPATVPAGPSVPTRVAADRPAVATGAAQRVRRSRAIASLVLLGGLVTAIVQLVVGLATGWSVGGVLVLGIGGVLVVSAVTLLRRLASVRQGMPAAPRVARMSAALPDIDLPSEPAVREWTPVPVPRPRMRPEVAPSTMSDPRIAAAAALEAQRRARLGTDREVAPMPPQRPQEPARPAAERPSRFASMGVVDDAGSALPDLDAMLARRRA